MAQTGGRGTASPRAARTSRWGEGCCCWLIGPRACGRQCLYGPVGLAVEGDEVIIVPDPGTKERPMATVLFETEKVTIPLSVNSLASFRRWVATDDFPEEGRICWLDNDVWADLSMEQIFTHVRVKTRICSVLDTIATDSQMGLFLADGALLVNVDVEFACV